jgi:hypothetical protein
MLQNRRMKWAFRREAKRITKDAEPVVQETSQAIISSLRETEELYEAHGYTTQSDTSYLDHWVMRKRRRFRK